MEQVLFNPGYSSCVLGVSDNAAFMYSAFQTSSMSFKQKKFQFSVILPKIKSMLKSNIAFYLGCLLWAVVISKKEAEIIENPCLGEEFNKDESFEEIDYLIELLGGGLNRDSKYFTNRPYEADPKFLPILKTYREFIIQNNGFVKTKKTSEIVLPSSIKAPSLDEVEKIKEKIDEALSKKDLTVLYDVYKVIL